MTEQDIVSTDPDVRPSEVTEDRVGLELDSDESATTSAEDEDEEGSGEDEAGSDTE